MDNETIQYLQDIVEEVSYMTVEPDQPLVVESLEAAQIKWHVDLDLEVEIPLEDYLEGLSIRELAELIDTARAGAGDLQPGWRT